MNWAASPLASREMLQTATERETILKAGKGSHKQRKRLLGVRSAFFWGWRGCIIDADQEILTHISGRG